jgi:hypothetical protein
MYVT